jgi:2,3-bisphosphoglycerate-independent phosphoglycerate mutase
MTRRVLFLFVDGIGLGPDDPELNPFAAAHTPTLEGLLGRRLTWTDEPLRRDGALLVPLDATLGVPGLPQSATGQTALLTGINAAQAAGRHVTAYPTAQLRALLAEHNLFTRVMALGGRVTLANAYTPEYFRAVETGTLRHAAITHSAISAGVALRAVGDLRAGRAVFHDLTNARPRSWGHDLPLITPTQAGANLAGLAMEYELTVFEFFITDLAAHGRISTDPRQVVEMLDGLLAGVMERADLAELLVLLVSDHGNLEDRRRSTHTRNPVPALLIGHGRDAVGEDLHAITDITPAICRWLAGALVHG